MKFLATWRSVLALCAVGCGLTAVVAQFENAANVKAFALGYLLFWLDVILIASLFRSLALAVKDGAEKPATGPTLFLLFSKFFGVCAALFLAIVKFKLPPLFIAGGALASLAAVTVYGVCCHLHVRRLGTEGA